MIRFFVTERAYPSLPRSPFPGISKRPMKLDSGACSEVCLSLGSNPVREERSSIRTFSLSLVPWLPRITVADERGKEPSPDFIFIGWGIKGRAETVAGQWRLKSKKRNVRKRMCCIVKLYRFPWEGVNQDKTKGEAPDSFPIISVLNYFLNFGYNGYG